MFHMAMYLAGLWFGGRIGWELGSGHGLIIGLICALVGAIGLSTLVGAVAGVFRSNSRHFEQIEGWGGRLTVSMVKWGVLRRLIVSAANIFVRPNGVQRPSFVPAFELAVFDSGVRHKPVVQIYFANGEAAQRGWDYVTIAIKQQGIMGATDYVCRIRPSEMREFGKLNPDAMAG